MPPPVILLLSALALLTAHPLMAQEYISQISDGQVQAGPNTTAAPSASEIVAPLEATSTTSEISTASALISVAALNNAAAVAAPSSTTGSALPTSILMAAPAGAAGAVGNYTGLQTVAGAPFPTPHVPIPVSDTSMAPVGGLNGTSAVATNGPTGMTTLAPTGANTGTASPSSTSTEGPLAATGAAVRIAHLGIGQSLFAAGLLAWLVGI